MKIIFVRHGQTSWNLQGKIQGQMDIPLDYLGITQTKLLSSRLEEEKVDIIFSSPLSRALNTAIPISNFHKTGVICTCLLSERNFGILEGFKPKQVDRDSKKQIILEKTINPTYKPNRGESLNDLQSRILEFFHFINFLDDSLSILCITHGGVLDLIYRMATNKPLNSPRTWVIPNTAVNIFDYSKNKLSLECWADINHLKNPSTLDEI